MTITAANSKRTERDYQTILSAALADERCPLNDPFGPIAQNTITRLVASGRISSAVYRHNWRVVTILTGEYRGRSTKAPPDPEAKPYLVNGVHMGRIENAQRKLAR